MAKRSSFEREVNNWYPTPEKNVRPLLPFLAVGTLFVEPCAGDGRLVRHLETAGHHCLLASDIAPRVQWVQQVDARDLKPRLSPAAIIITNPPYDRSRKLMHELIEHFRSIAGATWLLLEAGWAFSARAAPHLAWCTDIVPAGRMKIYPDSPSAGTTDYAWYRFVREPVTGQTPAFWPVGAVPMFPRKLESECC